MQQLDIRHMSFDEFDEKRDPRPEEQEFDRVVERALSRRGFLRGVLAFGSAATALGLSPLLNSGSAQAQTAAMTRFAFKPIPTATDFDVHVPEGYSWKPVAKWGQPLFSGIADLDPVNGTTAEAQEKAFGENTDGMELFNIGGRQVICVNHEYANLDTNLPGRPDGKPQSAEDVVLLQNAQGVAVFEIAESAEGWNVVLDSPMNRRITHRTAMELTGPAVGHDLLKTPADPDGKLVLGTLNNCGAGRTPWGTYLTCEENFNGYFGHSGALPAEGETEEQVKAKAEATAATLPKEFKRYGIGVDSVYMYHAFDPRFDLSQNANEPNRFGYIVEIDPSNPTAAPKKHTALGRFKHENAASVVARDGRVVVYMGDDERGEFLYKWVSRDAYVPGGDTSTLLVNGTLFVAKFSDDLNGEWLALTPESTGMTKAEIAIHTRMAASKLGATTMDRPEWVAVNPVAIEAYCALTNNSRRGVKPNAGGDETPVGGPNPRAENNYGQIVRWYPAEDDHAAATFTWDLFVMAGNPTVHKDAYAGSANINEGNMFNSPDGMMFDRNGLLWIQTDGDDSNEGDFAGQGNNQMLVGDPVTGRIERFLTGPKDSEITGFTVSSDRRTIFVGIQHPGGSWPETSGLPRSAVIAIRRDDGAIIA
ncbi:PhoX family protein [Thioclava sp. FR2]|uniref:PhoX family protein n=1 Tax=Thioclava sp. FR2 TaxID=3445780 RepID=UPI003EB70000